MVLLLAVAVLALVLLVLISMAPHAPAVVLLTIMLGLAAEQQPGA